ncbi:MAG: TatD family hydrolase [archaeon]
MKLIDVHAHLETKKFEKDLDEVIARAHEKKMIVINAGVNPATNRRALEIAEKYPEVIRVSFGMYPIDALAKEVKTGESDGFLRDIEKFDVDEEIKWIEKNKDKCIAIGEIGLDYNWEDFQTGEAKEMQKGVFRKLLSLAKKIKKPVIIHSRKAELDAIDILEGEGWKNENVIMHCFSGKKSLITRCVENGWFFSIPPVITRLQHFQTLVEMVPLSQILTETDSPYLSPVVGTRNEPENVAVTITEIAKIKKISEKEVAEQIWENAEKVFGF